MAIDLARKPVGVGTIRATISAFFQPIRTRKERPTQEFLGNPVFPWQGRIACSQGSKSVSQPARTRFVRALPKTPRIAMLWFQPCRARIRPRNRYVAIGGHVTIAPYLISQSWCYMHTCCSIDLSYKQAPPSCNGPVQTHPHPSARRHILRIHSIHKSEVVTDSTPTNINITTPHSIFRNTISQTQIFHHQLHYPLLNWTIQRANFYLDHYAIAS